VNVAMEAIDRLHTTAESHHRALIVEVMGRNVGWIALHAGMAGGANVILIPEKPFDMEKVCAYVEHRFETRYAPIVVVAEGARPVDGDITASGQLDEFGHVRFGGVGQMLAAEIEKRTGMEAISAVHDGDFGIMVALSGTNIVRIPLGEATRELKLVPEERYAEAEVL